MGTNGRKMRVSVKKMLQVVTVMSLMVYTTLMLKSYGDNSEATVAQWAPRRESRHVADKFTFQERLPQSLADNNDNYQSNDITNTALLKNDDIELKTDNKSMKHTMNNNSHSTLDDLFISVKTTKNFHQTRLNVILRTWFVLAREQTYFFTDADDELYQEKTNDHLINTNCSSSHNRKALCCKMSVEFDAFLESNKKWFCHFDDDNYVNIPQLVRLLQKYNPTEDWYLGKTSIRTPLEIINRDDMKNTISFWFATGGAGFCLSRSLALKMDPLASNGRFISIGEKIRLPDDVTMGYIIEYLLNKKLTVIDQFHSHLEPMKFIKQDAFPDQITFSYSRYGKESNIVTIDGFDDIIDPTRFLSLHCFLFPNFNFCPR